MDSVVRGIFKRALKEPLTVSELKIALDIGVITREDISRVASLLNDFEDSCPQCGYVDPSKGSVCPNCGHRFCV